MKKYSIFLLFVSILFSAEGIPAQTRTFSKQPQILLGLKLDRSASLTFVDVDGDRDLDVLVANGRHWPQVNEVFLNNGKGRFTLGYPLGVEFSTSYALPAGDLDGDGDCDVVVANDSAPNQIYRNDGKGRFSLAGVIGPEVEPTRGVKLADLNGDGMLDVLVTNRGTENGIYLNEGNLKFAKKRGFGTRDDATISLSVADVNQDGYPDLVLANRNGQENAVYLNDSKLSFSKSYPFGEGNDQTRAVAIADMDGDGHLDIVTANIGEANGVYFGDSTGLFDDGIRFGRPEGQTYSIIVMDMDKDGDPDIVTGNVRMQNAVYFNDGTGRHFVEVRFGGLEDITYGIAVGDVNADGFPDIGVANSDGLNGIHISLAAAPQKKLAATPIDPEAKLKELGITLPEPPNPVANYVNGVKTGNLLFLAGKGPKRADGSEIKGKLGRDISIEEGYEAARLTAINQLSVLKAMLGDLNKVKRIVKVLGMVNSDPSFVDQPAVINGFSDLIVEVFGDRGRHARAAVGMASLPRGIAVEIEMIVEIEK